MIETKEDPRLNVRFDTMYKKLWFEYSYILRVIKVKSIIIYLYGVRSQGSWSGHYQKVKSQSWLLHILARVHWSKNIIRNRTVLQISCQHSDIWTPRRWRAIQKIHSYQPMLSKSTQCSRHRIGSISLSKYTERTYFLSFQMEENLLPILRPWNLGPNSIFKVLLDYSAIRQEEQPS